MEPEKTINLEGQGIIRIHSESPYEHLDEPTSQWLRSLKQMWLLLKKSDATAQMLFNFFSISKDPYKSVLQITITCGDFYSGQQNSLAFYIMQTFSTWVKAERPNLIVSDSLKVDAFNFVIRQKSQVFTDLFIQVYRMFENKELFLDSIRSLITNFRYKEACNCVILLQLHKHFVIEDFVIPLVFQDKFTVVEPFLKGSRKHQIDLAKFLDDLIGKENITAAADLIAGNLNIHDAKVSRLYYKTVSRLLVRIIKTYNILPSTCPNLLLKRQKGALQFLLHKRFIEKSIGDEGWVEMVLEAVGDDENLQIELVEGVSYYGDLKEALHWAEKFNTPQEFWPYNLKKYSSRVKNGSVHSNLEENWDEPGETVPNMNFHKLALPESHIILVDSPDSFFSFLEDIAAGVTVVGFDSEWKPTFGFSRCDLSVMQVATSERIYILDIIALGSEAPVGLWERFATVLFCNDEILKLGFGLEEDLVLLKETLKKFHGIKTSDAGFLDLMTLKQTLMKKYNFVFPFAGTEDARFSKGLSSLVELCLGEKLDKSDQFSNWENRPLRKNQIVYAALDAYCLLEAYNVIVKECESQCIPLGDVINEVLSEGVAKNLGKKKKKNFRETRKFNGKNSPRENSLDAE